MKKLKKRLNQIYIVFKYIYYKTYCSFKKICNDNVWIISERGYEARDNSYFLFKYIRENHNELKIKYVISKDSPDYNKVKDIGEVVEYGSKEHYILFVTAGMLISTHLMGFSPDTGLFNKLQKKNLLKIKGKIVSLKHGITKDFLTTLNPRDTKLDLLIAGAKPEYEYMLKNFGFSEEILKYTGFARFDSLISKPSRQILLMPTFRKWIDYITNDDFKNTDYYKKINSFINNKKLLETLEKMNINIIFYPHFEFQKYIDLFECKSNRIILGKLKDYGVQELLKSSDLLITDYSSVFFDFAYMKKPTIYFQFDIEEYRKKHYQKGYFEYERDGFGKVYYNEEDVINHIIKYIENNFIIEKEYSKKIDSFFEYRDYKNCQRIYQELYDLYKKGEMSEGEKKEC